MEPTAACGRGIGERKIADFGAQFIECIAAYQRGEFCGNKSQRTIVRLIESIDRAHYRAIAAHEISGIIKTMPKVLAHGNVKGHDSQEYKEGGNSRCPHDIILPLRLCSVAFT